MVDWITDAKPLLALAEDWAVSPAQGGLGESQIHVKNPGMLSSHVNEGLFIDTEFWVANGEDLEAKFQRLDREVTPKVASGAIRNNLLAAALIGPLFAVVVAGFIVPLLVTLWTAVGNPGAADAPADLRGAAGLERRRAAPGQPLPPW